MKAVEKLKNDLKHLKSKNVFHFFEEICAIPHGSYHTKAISNYLVSFANERGLFCRQDSFDNVIIKKPATVGYEQSPVIMLQGHMDMVCEKTSNSAKDMLTEGLDLFLDGDLLGAKGTTLGADDGIAVAMMLAIVDSTEIPHAELECLFTSDEEVGMIGARGLDASGLRAKYLLNLDSEEEGNFIVSCAGSAREVCTFNGNRIPFEGEILELRISGLVGGHSGEKIHEGRANANLLMGRALYRIGLATELRLIDLFGGTKENAIPRESTAKFAVGSRCAAEQVIDELWKEVKLEYQRVDPEITFSLNPCQANLLPFDGDASRRIISFLYCIPNGVQNMSADIEGLVQTSLNLGIVQEENQEIVFTTMVRSSVDSQKEEVLEKVTILCESLGGVAEIPMSYPGWQYNPNSKLRETVKEVFLSLYKKEPHFAALHAGLECGILSGKMPELDCISFGPDTMEIHTPDERVSVSSTERTWMFLLKLLQQLK